MTIPGTPAKSSSSGGLSPIASGTILGNGLGIDALPEALAPTAARSVIGLGTSNSPTFTGLTLTGTGTLQLPAGTTAQRVAIQGVRWNSTDNRHEFYNPATMSWGNFARTSGDTFSGKLTTDNGINVANNQFIQFARTTGYVGWFLMGVDNGNILRISANNASLAMDPISGVVTSSGSVQIGATGPLLRNNAGVIEARNSANTFDSNFRAMQLLATQSVTAQIDGSSVSYYASGALRKTTGGVWFWDNPFADGEFVWRTGTGFTERLRLSNAGVLTATSLAESSVAASGTGGLVRANSPSLVTPVLGRANATALTLSEALTLGVRTIATLPLASTSNGQSFRVSDSPVTPNRIVTSDGTDWHYEGLAYTVGTKIPGAIVIKIDTTTTGQKNLFLRVPYACTIVSWELAANASGSVVIDIWEDTYANYPPINADSITGTAKPTITAGTRAQSAALTGWITSLAAGDYLEVEVESVTTITSVTLTLNVERVS
jgi:hypothetical protein